MYISNYVYVCVCHTESWQKFSNFLGLGTLSVSVTFS